MLIPQAIVEQAGRLIPLFDQTLGADAASIDTGTFSTAFSHLMIVTYCRTTQAAIISSVSYTFNSDGGSNYDNQIVRGRDTTASAADGQAAAVIIFDAPGASAAAGVFGGTVLFVPNYSGTVGEKATIEIGGFADEATTGGHAGLRTAHWRNTAAIERATFTATSGNLLAGSRISVYAF